MQPKPRPTKVIKVEDPDQVIAIDGACAFGRRKWERVKHSGLVHAKSQLAPPCCVQRCSDADGFAAAVGSKGECLQYLHLADALSRANAIPPQT